MMEVCLHGGIPIQKSSLLWKCARWRHSHTEELIMMEVCLHGGIPTQKSSLLWKCARWRHSHTEELIMMEVCLHGGIPTQKTSYYGSVPFLMTAQGMGGNDIY